MVFPIVAPLVYKIIALTPICSWCWDFATGDLFWWLRK